MNEQKPQTQVTDIATYVNETFSYVDVQRMLPALLERQNVVHYQIEQLEKEASELQKTIDRAQRAKKEFIAAGGKWNEFNL